MKPVMHRTFAAMALVMSLSLLTACPSKDSGGGTAVVPPAPPPCVVGTLGCLGPAGAGLLVNLVSQGPNSAPLLMQYSISGDPAQIQQISANGQNVINAYTGQVTITGSLTSNAAIPMGLCSIPAGISVPFQATGQANGHGIFTLNQMQVSYGVMMAFNAQIVIIQQGSAQTAGRAAMNLFMTNGPHQFQPGVSTACNDMLGLVLD